ncbi:replication-associated protein [Odonata-associated circular virus-19]|uniref:replication-associated protein n=1 Tax=Odonata-associated circular virus-19 TaxID=1592119 RepID=UPI000585DF06|nr:replication-associated protein [Odonata-associated circular virus-19]AJD07498.1 replication-associated protein [Odonata-associated circular virus-19]AJD07501.1 replication-associated protein [Odonata-associated circular virus-19]
MSFQYHNFVFTSFKTEDFERVLGLDVQYIIVGKETCPETKREHLQGYCELDKKKTMAGIKKLFSDDSLHIEARKGTQKEAIIYCQKEGNWKEAGVQRKQGSRGDLDGARVMAVESGMRAVSRSMNMQQIRVAEKFLSYNEEVRDWKPEVLWFWGDSGSGKSREARFISHGLDTYVKNTGGKWWDGYDGHEVVIIDDFRDSWWALTYFLACTDRYEFQVEVKGGFRQLRAKMIIITSLFHPKYMYREAQAKGDTAYQILRRIDSVVHFGSQKPEVGGNTIAPTVSNFIDETIGLL